MAGRNDYNGREIQDDLELNDEETTRQAWAKRNLLTLDGGGIRGYWSLLALKQLMEEIAKEELRQDADSTHSYHPLRYLPDTTHVEVDGQKTTATCAQSGWERVDTLTRAQRYLPCHYFDFIGGSSTGGLIAILLGRLRMTVEDCLKEYEDLSHSIFGNPRHFTQLRYYLINRTKYDTQPVDAVFEDVSNRRGELRENNDYAPHEFCSETGICQTAVISIRSEPGQIAVVDTTYFIRSYDFNPPSRSPTTSREPTRARTFLSQESAARHQAGTDTPVQNARTDHNVGRAHKFPIPKVARAATAAPYYFDPLEVEDNGVRYKFSDGGMGVTNNPTKAMIEHLENHIPLDEHADYGKLQTVVSVGTARHDAAQHREEKKIGQKIKGAYSKWSNPQDVHREIKSDYVEKRQDQESYFFYYRLNPNVNNHQHLLNLDLDDWRPKTGPQPGSKTLKTIRDAFYAWFATDTIARARFEKCAASLVAQRKARIRDSEKWERYAHCASYSCDRRCGSDTSSFASRTEFCRHLQQHHRVTANNLESAADRKRHTWIYKPRREACLPKPPLRSKLRFARRKLFRR